MTLKELKESLATIPKEMDEYIVVNGEFGFLNPEDENSMVYSVGNPILAVYVDRQTEEIFMLNQTKEDINNLFPNNNLDGNTEGTE